MKPGVTFRFLNRLLTREGTGISGLSSWLAPNSSQQNDPGDRCPETNILCSSTDRSHGIRLFHRFCVNICRETLCPCRFYVCRTYSTITRYSFTIRTSAKCSSRSVTSFYLDKQPRGLLLPAASWAPDECVKFNSCITDAMGVEGDLDPHRDGPLALITLPQDYIKDLIYLLVLAAL